MGNSFFDRFADLCKSAGKTPNYVAKQIGASSGSVTAWKNGTEPRLSTATKLAAYFGVSTDYLLGKEEKAPTESGERNIIKIAGRDGTYKERYLSDEQLSMIKTLINQLPEVSDDL